MRDEPPESESSQPAQQADWFEQRATITLAILCVGVGILHAIGRDVSDLALDPARNLVEPWRFATCTLIHVGIAHLFFNVQALLSFGRMLEPILGLARTSAAYLVFAAGSMAAEYAFWGSNPVGISGIVFGQIGLLWGLSRWHPAYRGILPESTARWAVGLFFVFLALTLAGWLRIANVAHLAGGLLGILLGWVLSRAPERRERLEWLAPAAAVTLVVLALFGRNVVNFGSETSAQDLGARALAALQANEFEKAHEMLERAVVIDPDDHRLWQNLGAARMDLERPEAALEAFERASQVDPSYVRARAVARSVRLKLAEDARMALEYDLALEYVDAALTADPGDADAHALRGVVLEAQGNLEGALEAYEFALAIGTSEFDFLGEYRDRVVAQLGR